MTSILARPVARMNREERRQMEHEHNRLYAALETAAELAELAGHDILAAQLRRERHDVWAEIERGGCGERPG